MNQNKSFMTNQSAGMNNTQVFYIGNITNKESEYPTISDDVSAISIRQITSFHNQSIASLASIGGYKDHNYRAGCYSPTDNVSLRSKLSATNVHKLSSNILNSLIQSG